MSGRSAEHEARWCCRSASPRMRGCRDQLGAAEPPLARASGKLRPSVGSPIQAVTHCTRLPAPTQHWCSCALRSANGRGLDRRSGGAEAGGTGNHAGSTTSFHMPNKRKSPAAPLAPSVEQRDQQKSPRVGSKQELLRHLLSQPEGASLKELASATGWLPHTTRAALTGLRRRGLILLKEKAERCTRYRIEAA
jgi:hypothetical protein